MLENYLDEHDDITFIIGGHCNTVIDVKMDKTNGWQDIHKLCRQEITSLINRFNVVDIWREKQLDLKQYTWHSSHKPPIVSRLDFFLISDNLVNSVRSSEHKLSYKSDHSIGLLRIDVSNITRGSGYFKLNKSLLLDAAYQDKINRSRNEIATINNNANPIILWELIKGTVRNETIKYATIKTKETS